MTAVALEWETPDDDASSPHAPMQPKAGEEDLYVSTLQIDNSEEPSVELDEATIERSIAEINEVIRRKS